MRHPQAPSSVSQVWDLLENTGLLRRAQPLGETFRVPRPVSRPHVQQADITGGIDDLADDINDTLGADGAAEIDELLNQATVATGLSGELSAMLNDDAPFSAAQWESLDIPASQVLSAKIPGAPAIRPSPSSSYPHLPHLHIADRAFDDDQQDYQLRRVVGEGGAGQIVLAEQRSLFREVALKRSKPGAEATFPEEMLLQEGMMMGHLEHPNIIPVHAMGLGTNREPLLVMKYVEGVPWSALLGDDAHPFWSKLKVWSIAPMIRHIEILLEICQALEFAHAKGILHRDIKPANVMLGAYGEVYLLDWGLGYVLDHNSPLAPAMQALAPPDEEEGFYGTPAYMAPEMFEDESALGPWTDIYLLGGVLYEILHGYPPHQGETIEDVILAVFDETPPPFAPDCPAELVRICERALRFEPDERYQSVAAFREELVGFLQHRASLTLSDEAWRTLRRLQDAVNKDEVDSTRERDLPLRRWYDTCHFGFLQALREWPDNKEARRGLQEAFQAMFWVELQQGHLEAAQLLREDLEASLGDTNEETLAMAAAIHTARQKQARLQQLHHAADFTVARKQRVRLLLGMGVAATLFAVIRLILGEAPDLHSGYRRALVFVGLTSVVLSAGLFWGRKALFQNDANRRFVMLLIMCCVVVTIHRSFRAYYGHPLHLTFVFDMVLLGCMVCVAALTLRLWLGWIAVMLLLGAALGWLYPGQVYHVMTLSIAASWLLCGFFWSNEHTEALSS